MAERIPQMLDQLRAEMNRAKNPVDDAVLDKIRDRLGPGPKVHLTPEAIARKLEELSKSTDGLSMAEVVSKLRSLDSDAATQSTQAKANGGAMSMTELASALGALDLNATKKPKGAKRD